MTPHLLFPDRDFDPEAPGAPHEMDLVQDLGLDLLIDAMGGEDGDSRTIARRGLLGTLAGDARVARHRQGILRDCLREPGLIADMHAVASEAIEERRRRWLGLFGRTPGSHLFEGVVLLEAFVPLLGRLHRLAAEALPRCESQGLRRLMATLRDELSESYLAEVRSCLRTLQFRRGVLFTARLGRENVGTGCVLRARATRGARWMGWALDRARGGWSFRLGERDDAGARILGEMRDRAINDVANAIAQAAEHVLAFFTALRAETGFFLGCIRLHHALSAAGVPLCFPEMGEPGSRAWSATGLRNPGLALASGQPGVDNAFDATGRRLIVITGANQGGKSTFLRSLGLAQVMMQAGLFVAAETFSAPIVSGVFTHFRREEDAGFRHGKLDEELARMGGLVDLMRPGALVLFNESFATTRESEGSAIAHEVVGALIEAGVAVVFVTHLETLGRLWREEGDPGMLFLRAERTAEGRRTFRLLPGAPLETSFAEDVYREVFGGEGEDA